MRERFRDGGFGTFLGTMKDLETRVPDAGEHQRLTDSVEELSDEEVRKRFVALLEAVNPNEDCICSDLAQVDDAGVRICAYHTSRVGWIVHQARQIMPSVVDR
jgi:hypothetical protein